MFSILLKAIRFVLGFSSVATAGYVFYNNAFTPDGSVIRGRVGNREERRHSCSRTYCWCGATLPNSRVWSL